MSSSTTIKCLMIGQAGIGKSTFLKKFPNSKQLISNDETTIAAAENISSSSSSNMKQGSAGKKNTPTTTTTTTTKRWKETYSIEYMNSRFETVPLEIDNCDISLETCLQSTVQSLSANEIASGATAAAAAVSTPMISSETSHHSLSKMSAQYIQMVPVHSSKFISIDAYNVIILCFALDDSNSCELIKSKWEVELKRNRALQRHSFILLGFKSDLVFGNNNKNNGATTVASGASNEKNENQKENNNNKAKKMKKRSSSVNSNSSTSRLKRRERMTSSEHDSSTNKLLINNAKKLAKQIGVQLIMVSSDAGSSQQQHNSTSPHELTIYEKFLKSISKKSELVERQRRRDEEKAEKKNTKRIATTAAANSSNNNSTNNSNNNSFKTSKIPKSISAPLSFLRAKTTTNNGRVKMTDDQEEDDSLSVRNKNEHANESFVDNNINNKHPSTVEDIKPNEINSNEQENKSSNEKEKQQTVVVTGNNLSIRGKLSRFAIGLGTYLVTCGATTRTRKLADMKRLKNKTTYEESSSVATTKNTSSVITSGISSSAARKFPIKRNKSWLLLSSELSINSTENDEVFS